MTAIRLIKAVIVGAIALFFTLVSFNNLTDFETNRSFISQVVSLDTVQNHNISWRAVVQPGLQLSIYLGFIAWEIATALLLWIGALRIARHLQASPERFKQIRSMALIGITMGFALYMVGFVDLASEWFYVWNSPELKGGQLKALLFSLLMLLSLNFVAANN